MTSDMSDEKAFVAIGASGVIDKGKGSQFWVWRKPTMAAAGDQKRTL